MILMKLDCVWGIHYIPILSFNSRQEDVCWGWVLCHPQGQYCHICKSKAIVNSLTDLIEVATFKEQKHCLLYYTLFESEINLGVGTR